VVVALPLFGAVLLPAPMATIAEDKVVTAVGSNSAHGFEPAFFTQVNHEVRDKPRI
jgi:hypothetical protein